MGTCYACWRPATSDEHVPPRCFFPEVQLAGRDLRRNLITVRACDAHNSRKSKDDEFMRLMLCTALDANRVAWLQASTKVASSIARKPALARSVLRDGRDVDVVDRATGQVLPGSLIPFDAHRFFRAIELMARGLFLHCHEQKWDRDVRIHCELLGSDDAVEERQHEELRRLVRQAADLHFANAPERGDNPDVFRFQVARQPDGYYAMRLFFYGGCRITLLFAPEDTGGGWQQPIGDEPAALEWCAVRVA